MCPLFAFVFFFIACSASTLSVCLSTVGNCSVVVSLQKSERFICKMTQPLEITPKERQFDIYQCFFFQTGFLNFLKLRGDTRQTSAFIIRFFAMQPQREYYMYFLSFRNFQNFFTKRKMKMCYKLLTMLGLMYMVDCNQGLSIWKWIETMKLFANDF